jgi:hypothetical protein
VNDQAVWEQSIESVKIIYSGLSIGIAAELDGLIEDIMQLKQNLVELATSAGSSAICRTCFGECCRHGKYHVSVLDIMAYLKTGIEPISPDFSTNPTCPYSDIAGCIMAPDYRPMTCVVFNCQQVEELLTSAQQDAMFRFEQELRNAITRAGLITGMRLDRALLLSCS